MDEVIDGTRESSHNGINVERIDFKINDSETITNIEVIS